MATLQAELTDLESALVLQVTVSRFRQSVAFVNNINELNFVLSLPPKLTN
jgi:hypothetical protein